MLRARRHREPDAVIRVVSQEYTFFFWAHLLATFVLYFCVFVVWSLTYDSFVCP